MKQTKDAYEIISSYYVKYKRLNSSLVEVYTDGYCSAGCIQMEQELKDIDVLPVKRDYDKTTGRTVTVYKQSSKKWKAG